MLYKTIIIIDISNKLTWAFYAVSFHRTLASDSASGSLRKVHDSWQMVCFCTRNKHIMSYIYIVWWPSSSSSSSSFLVEHVHHSLLFLSSYSSSASYFSLHHHHLHQISYHSSAWSSLWMSKQFKENVCCITLQGTNISPQNGIFKMIFVFPRWDMYPFPGGYALDLQQTDLFLHLFQPTVTVPLRGMPIALGHPQRCGAQTIAQNTQAVRHQFPIASYPRLHFWRFCWEKCWGNQWKEGAWWKKNMPEVVFFLAAKKSYENKTCLIGMFFIGVWGKFVEILFCTAKRPGTMNLSSMLRWPLKNQVARFSTHICKQIANQHIMMFKQLDGPKRADMGWLKHVKFIEIY